MRTESFNIDDSGAHQMPPDIAATSLAGLEWGGGEVVETPDVPAGYNEQGGQAEVEMSPDEKLTEIVSGAQTVEGLARELRQSGMETEGECVEAALRAFAKSPDKPTAKAPLMKMITNRGGSNKEGGLRTKVVELFDQGKLFEMSLVVSHARTIEGLARELSESGMEDESDRIKAALRAFASSASEPTAMVALTEGLTDEFGIKGRAVELFGQGKLFEV